jgi:hypothetical protein
MISHLTLFRVGQASCLSPIRSADWKPINRTFDATLSKLLNPKTLNPKND